MRRDYLAQEKTAPIFAKLSPQGTATDTGSAESQIGLLTYRINHLTEHLKLNHKDNSTKIGLMRLVGKRKRLLKYLERKDVLRYRQLIAELGIRK